MIAIVAPVKHVLDFKTKIVIFADGFLGSCDYSRMSRTLYSHVENVKILYISIMNRDTIIHSHFSFGRYTVGKSPRTQRSGNRYKIKNKTKPEYAHSDFFPMIRYMDLYQCKDKNFTQINR